MAAKGRTRQQLVQENQELRDRLAVAEQTLRAFALLHPADMAPDPRVETAQNALLLAASEERYRALFATMAEGCGVHEIITDADGNPCDYRFLDVNPAFEELTGLKREDVLGRRVKELLPRLEPSWVERFGRVALTGEPVRFENYASELGRWYHVVAYRNAPRQVVTIFTDVSERKVAEQELLNSRADLDRAQQVGQIGSWRLDVRRNVLTWSDENHRIFGVPKGTALTYQTFLGLVHPADVTLVDTAWRAALAGVPYDLEHRLLVDGEVKWVRERAFLEFDDAGELLGGFGTTQDVTELKRAQEQIASLARFPQQNPSPVLRIRSDGVVALANPAAEPLLSANGSGVAVPAPALWQTWVRDALSLERRQTAEIRHRRRTYSFDIVPLPEEGYANLYGRDVSVQSRSIAALRRAKATLEAGVAARTKELSESTALLENMFDNARVHLAHLDKDLRILRVNQAYMRAGGDPSFFGGGETVAILRHVIRTGQPYSAYAKPLVRAEREGVSYWDWDIRPVKGMGGETEGVLVSLIDVTTRVRLQGELVKTEERERHAISQELHDTTGQQLSGIGYMLDNLEAELAERGMPQAQRLRNIRSAVSEVDAQVRRISRGLHPAFLASGGLPAALEDLARRVEARYELSCSCECPGTVELEPEATTQLHRIAQEAVNNAVKHANATRIRIRLESKSGKTMLSIEDDGAGVPEDLAGCPGLGRHIMDHRADSVGATLTVLRGARGGTLVLCTLQSPHAKRIRKPRRTAENAKGKSP